jgi:hypothetical protein
MKDYIVQKNLYSKSLKLALMLALVLQASTNIFAMDPNDFSAIDHYGTTDDDFPMYSVQDLITQAPSLVTNGSEGPISKAEDYYHIEVDGQERPEDGEIDNFLNWPLHLQPASTTAKPVDWSWMNRLNPDNDSKLPVNNEVDMQGQARLTTDATKTSQQTTDQAIGSKRKLEEISQQIEDDVDLTPNKKFKKESAKFNMTRYFKKHATDGLSRLHKAILIRNGRNIYEIKKIIDENPKLVNVGDKDGWTPIYYVTVAFTETEYKKPQKVAEYKKVLAEKWYNNKVCRIEYALTIMIMLLHADADTNIIDTRGQNLLSYAKDCLKSGNLRRKLLESTAEERRNLLVYTRIKNAIKILIEQHLYTAQDLSIESIFPVKTTSVTNGSTSPSDSTVRSKSFQTTSTTDNPEAAANNEGDTQKSK